MVDLRKILDVTEGAFGISVLLGCIIGESRHTFPSRHLLMNERKGIDLVSLNTQNVLILLDAKIGISSLSRCLRRRV